MGQLYFKSLLLIVFVLTSQCWGKDFNYCSHINRLVDNAISQYSKEENMKLFGYGGGMMHDIYTLSTHFVTLEPLTVDEARWKYIQGTQYLLKAINQDQTIRPYLHDFPFTHSNLEFRISYFGNNPQHACAPYVNFLFELRGELRYKSKNPQTGEYTLIHSETYEEALKIVREQERT